MVDEVVAADPMVAEANTDVEVVAAVVADATTAKKKAISLASVPVEDLVVAEAAAMVVAVDQDPVTTVAARATLAETVPNLAKVVEEAAAVAVLETATAATSLDILPVSVPIPKIGRASCRERVSR